MNLTELTGALEAVSAEYATRWGFRRDGTWFLLKLQEEVGELTQAYLMQCGQARSKGLSADELQARFRAKLADVLGHVLLLAHFHGVDLAEEIDRKWLTHLGSSTGFRSADSPEFAPPG